MSWVQTAVVVAFVTLFAYPSVPALVSDWRRSRQNRANEREAIMARDEDITKMLSGLRCPICSAAIKSLEVGGQAGYSDLTHVPPQARVKYRHLTVICVAGCKIETQGRGAEALYRTFQSWLKMRHKLKLPKKNT